MVAVEARPICLRLLVHWIRRAASRAAWTAGSSNATRTAMMAITTNNSIRVKPHGLESRRGADEWTRRHGAGLPETSPGFPPFEGGDRRVRR